MVVKLVPRSWNGGRLFWGGGEGRREAVGATRIGKETSPGVGASRCRGAVNFPVTVQILWVFLQV
jgi:hypothetical protein